jgi:hypothetical protein
MIKCAHCQYNYFQTYCVIIFVIFKKLAYFVHFAKSSVQQYFYRIFSVFSPNFFCGGPTSPNLRLLSYLCQPIMVLGGQIPNQRKNLFVNKKTSNVDCRAIALGHRFRIDGLP